MIQHALVQVSADKLSRARWHPALTDIDGNVTYRMPGHRPHSRKVWITSGAYRYDLEQFQSSALLLIGKRR